MICFKDQSFCNAECENYTCSRMFTGKIVKEAQEWWGSENPPISLMDMSIGCSAYIPRQEHK